MGGHQRTARLRMAQFGRPLIEGPAQDFRLVRCPGNIDEGRERIEQNGGVVAREGKASADEEDLASAVVDRDAIAIDRRQDVLAAFHG